MADIFQAVR